jgi:hypothetical protein
MVGNINRNSPSDCPGGPLPEEQATLEAFWLTAAQGGDTHRSIKKNHNRIHITNQTGNIGYTTIIFLFRRRKCTVISS